MISFLIILAILVAVIYILFRQPTLGKAPSGDRLERIMKSQHYKNKEFQNLSFTPTFAERTSGTKVMFNFIFDKKLNLTPVQDFRFTKTDLKKLNPTENVYP